jgi:PAS domain S-box-containing protein
MVDREGLVSFMNPAAEKMSGLHPDELLGRALNDRLKHHAADGSPLEGADYPLTRSLATAETVTGLDGVFVSSNGTFVDVACSFAPIVHHGSVAAAVVVLHDVSERKRAEERLRQAQKLESIGLLAGGIAHDFNNLLTGILGNASLAQGMLPYGSEAVSVLEQVIAASERAAHLTRQMLAYSGKGRFIIEPVDLSKLSRDITNLLQASIPKAVIMRLDVAAGLPAVQADAGQMQQVIMNLVLNAAEAIGDQKGLVTLRTGVYRVTEQNLRNELDHAEIPMGTYVALEVQDSGCGMDDTTKGRIFDPFFSTKFTGRGLGLAAVAGIVRSHHGAIQVTTTTGHGSKFLVLFPAAAAPASHPTAGDPAARELGGDDLILVVDDEEVVLQAATLALRHHGYTVLQADGGPAAIEILKHEKRCIALVILDLSMPGMNGLETLAELRKIRSDVEVIISSGYGEEETMLMFRGQPVSGFLQKPYTSARLAAKVKATLDRLRSKVS